MITKCKNCGKLNGDHNATTQECPKGKKHRTLGYVTFGPEKFEEDRCGTYQRHWYTQYSSPGERTKECVRCGKKKAAATSNI